MKHKCHPDCTHPAHEIFVPATALVGAKIMYVGLGPGLDEVVDGESFVGSAGRRLTWESRAAGIGRDSAWVTNWMKYWPPADKPSNLPKDIQKQCTALLREEILQFLEGGGECIVPLGGEAMRGLIRAGFIPFNPNTGMDAKPQISRWRGSILSLRDAGNPQKVGEVWKGGGEDFCKVIPTVHPAYVQRIWDANFLFKKDLQRIAREQRNGWPATPSRQLDVCDPRHPSLEQFFDIARADPNDPIALDTESVGGQLHCLSASIVDDWAISIAGDDREAVLDILRLPNPKVWHHAQHDLTFLEEHCNLSPAGRQHCTQQLWSAHSPELANGGRDKKTGKPAVGKSLAVLCSLFTREPYYKDELKEWHTVGDETRFREYNARDAAVTIELFHKLYKMVDDAGLLPVYEFDMSTLPAFRRSMRRGIPVDRKAKTGGSSDLTKETSRLASELQEIAGYEFNVRSWQQVLQAALQVGVELKDTQRETIQAELLRQQKRTKQNVAAISFLTALLEYKTLEKQRGTYTDFPLYRDGRLHVHWTYPGTETGRPTSSKSIIFTGSKKDKQGRYEKGGLSFNTVPPDQRHLFVADPGWTVVSFDLAKAELRIIANLAGCDTLIEALDSQDMWQYVNDRLTGTFKNVAIKNCFYGSVYIGGPRTIANEMNARARAQITSEKEIRDVQNEIFSTFKEIPLWHEHVKNHIKQTLTLKSLILGRQRRFRPRGRGIDPETHRQAVNFEPQATVPEIITRAVLMADAMDGYELWGHMYDGLLCQLHTHKLDTMIHWIKSIIEHDLTVTDIFGARRTFTIPCDVQTGPTWGDLEDWKG